MLKNDSNEKFPKVRINWFPGHMAKTRKQISEDLKLIDIVIELLDARIPMASRNPDIKEITKNKKRIILLNKCDLADSELNQKWVSYLSKEAPTILTDSNSGKGVDKVLKKIEEIMEPEQIKWRARGLKNKTIRVMILGIPNVGKSSFINRIAKKNSAVVGNRPGVTRQKQWIRLSKNIELLDTPGVLWPKFDDNKTALNLAFTGTIKDDILELVEIAYELLKKLYVEEKEKIIARYKLEESDINLIESKENKIYELMKVIGRKRGAIISGGEVDDEKVSRIVLDDFRSGKIGNITLENPER